MALKGRILKKHQKDAGQNVIVLPLLIKLLMKIKLLKEKVVAEGLKRNAMHFN